MMIKALEINEPNTSRGIIFSLLIHLELFGGPENSPVVPSSDLDLQSFVPKCFSHYLKTETCCDRWIIRILSGDAVVNM